MTKLQLGLSGALAVAGATGFVVQADTNAQLRDEIAHLRQENTAIAPLQTENQRLARSAADVAELQRDDAEFARLQEEAGVLRKRLQQLAQADAARATASANNAGVFDLAQLDRAPVARFQARPQYPFEARRAGVTGEVVVDFIVDANGDVQNATAARAFVTKPEGAVVKLSDFVVAAPGTAQKTDTTDSTVQREFEAAAVEAVSKWKFKAGQKAGSEVKTHLQVPIVFTLN